MIINYKTFTEGDKKILGIIFLIAIIAMLVVLIVVSVLGILSLSKDKKALTNNDLVSIIGKILKFKRSIEPESGIQVNDRPIVLILETGEEVDLLINDKIIVGETYKFNYLKNCRIAEVVEKI